MNRRRLLAALVAAVGLGAVASWGMGRAGAEYAVVGDDLVQWEWATSGSTSTYQVTDIAVRPDGWLVVATSTGWDGQLHLIPPWGGKVDGTNRFGPTDLGFRQLEVSRGRLFGLRQENERTDIENHAPGELYELDLRTGDVRRDLGTWWYQDLATDPVTGELVLQTSGGRVEPYRHDLVRFDPDTGVQTLLRSDNEAGDDPLEVTYSADGQRLFVAHTTGSTTDVLGRDGGLLYSMPLGVVDTLVAGRPGTCYTGAVLASRFDGSVVSVAPRSGATARPVATGGRPGVVSYATLDNDGNLVTARVGEITVLGCPGFVPPQPPALPRPDAPAPVIASAGPASTPAPATAAPPAPASAVPQPTAAAAPPPPGPPPPPPPPAPPPAPPAPPAPMAVPSALGPAMQAAAAPTVGIADVPDQEHITSLAAAAEDPSPALLYGAAIALALAAAAVARRPATFAAAPQSHVRHGDRP